MSDPTTVARVVRRPLHSILLPFPVACFTGALITDITYASTAEMMWADFSAWLVTIGVILGVLTGILLLIDFIRLRVYRAQTAAWAYLVGSGVVLVLAVFDALIHTRDAWTSVVPTGLVLSAATVAVMLVTAWFGRSIASRDLVRSVA